MANHKRKGPKSTRSGCLYCKPWKRQGNGKDTLKTKYGYLAQLDRASSYGLEG